MEVWIESPFDSLPVEGYRKQRYWLMAEAFVAAGHSVVYWTSDFSHANKRKRKVQVKVRAEGQSRGPDEGKGDGSGRDFKLVTVPTRPYGKNVCLARIRSHREYAREWGRSAEAAVRDKSLAKPDLIVVATPPLSTGDVAIRLARKFGAKLVVDVQDAWPETFYRLLPRGFGWLGGLILSGMHRAARRLYRAADLVTGVCDRYAALVRRAGAKDYYRAYLGIEIGGGLAADGEGAGRRGESAQTALRLAYVGNLGASYDIGTVVAGVRRLRQELGEGITLDVAGFGGTVAAEDGVRFHGMLGRKELDALLAKCDIGLVPMKSDSFVGVPNKLCEYAAAGLRIVSSLTGETQALLEKYRCGATYRWGDAASLAAAVRAARTCESARTMCEREFDAARIYRDYVERLVS